MYIFAKKMKTGDEHLCNMEVDFENEVQINHNSDQRQIIYFHYTPFYNEMFS